jgi:hypothetical protein
MRHPARSSTAGRQPDNRHQQLALFLVGAFGRRAAVQFEVFVTNEVLHDTLRR